jgi:hypothetical protein
VNRNAPLVIVVSAIIDIGTGPRASNFVGHAAPPP